MKKNMMALLLVSTLFTPPLYAKENPFDTNVLVELKKLGVPPNKVLKVGQQAPPFQLKNADNKSLSLAQLLKKGPLVLTFYRGNWCPYCNKAMQDLKAAHPQIQALGATLLAVSPQTQDNTRVMKRKYKLPFEVASDPNNALSRQYGLMYKVPPEALKTLKTFFIELKNYNGNGSNELPITATYIINRQGKVVYRFVDPNYKTRATPQDIIKVLKTL